jgi:hypothetical protein
MMAVRRLAFTPGADRPQARAPLLRHVCLRPSAFSSTVLTRCAETLQRAEEKRTVCGDFSRKQGSLGSEKWQPKLMVLHMLRKTDRGIS